MCVFNFPRIVCSQWAKMWISFKKKKKKKVRYGEGEKNNNAIFESFKRIIISQKCLFVFV